MRIIPRLDIKGENLVKGVNLEGFRALGNANSYAINYYKESADEIILNDIVASLYDRNTLYNFINKISKEIFIPLIVGGGIISLKDIEFLLKSGADRVFLNSSIINNPKFLDEAIKYFGSSTIIVSIETVKYKNNYTCVTNSGRELSGLELSEWIKKVESKGTSEILVTSVDEDGIGNGFDQNLINILEKTVKSSYIISGGYGNYSHLNVLKNQKKISGISIASALHYTTKDKVNTNNLNYDNYIFLLKKKTFKNFKKTNIRKIKKILDTRL